MEWRCPCLLIISTHGIVEHEFLKSTQPLATLLGTYHASFRYSELFEFNEALKIKLAADSAKDKTLKLGCGTCVTFVHPSALV